MSVLSREGDELKKKLPVNELVGSTRNARHLVLVHALGKVIPYLDDLALCGGKNDHGDDGENLLRVVAWNILESSVLSYEP